MRNDDFDGFSIYLLQDDEGDFVAHFIELPNVSASGSTKEEALAELKEAWEAMRESYCKHDEEIPVAPGRQSKKNTNNVDFIIL